MKRFFSIFFLFFLFLVNIKFVQANDCISKATGNWSAAASWNNCGGTIPQAGDNVTVQSSHTITVDTVDRTMANLQVNNGGILTLTKNITVNGNFTVNGTTSSTGTITLSGSGTSIDGTGISTSGGITINNNKAVNNTANLTINGPVLISAGAVLTNNGAITLNSSTSVLTLTGNWTQGSNSTLTVKANGVGVNISGGVFDCFTNNNSVIYNSGSAQTIAGVNFYNLTIGGSNAKTLQAGTATINGNFIVSGSAAVATVADLSIIGNFDDSTTSIGTAVTLAGYNFTVNGSTSVTGKLNFSSATGLKTFTGDVTVSGVWNETSAAVINFGGNFINNATSWITSTGIHTFSGSSKTISGLTATVIPSLTSSGTITNNGTLNISTILNISGGTFTNGSTGILNLGAASITAIGTFSANTAGNTVNYNATNRDQTIFSTTYSNLAIDKTGRTGTLGGDTTINGNFNIINGTFNANGKTVTLAGNSQQTISGTPTFYNLTVTNNSGTYTARSCGAFTPSIIFASAATVTEDFIITSPSVKIQYKAGSTYIFKDVSWNGQSADTPIVFGSDSSSQWNISITGSKSIDYLDVSYSNGSVDASNAGNTNKDCGNNSGWIFAPEAIPPTIDQFSIPNTATSNIISITSFTASDNVGGSGVAGYFISESDTIGNSPVWLASAPSTFTFSGGQGQKTAYAWVKDSAGNISSRASATVTIEYPLSNVYYSVGSSAVDLKTGAPKITISSGVASFTDGNGTAVAQTGNIGVGDKVTYNTNVIAYISGKIDQSHWRLTTATGATPLDVSNISVVSIRRTFNSINSAAAASFNSTHLNNADLTSINVILNIVCYYDGSADTSNASFSNTAYGYVTSSTNYIRIYTPYDTANEVNQSQRHQGKWTDNAYQIKVSDTNGLRISNVNNVRIDGLQIWVTHTNANNQKVLDIIPKTGAQTDYYVSNNIIRGYESASYSIHQGISFYQPGATGTAKVWNNIVYDTKSDPNVTGIVGISLGTSSLTYYVYNNTVYNSTVGISAGTGSTVIAKNNISTGNLASDFSGDFDSSSSNNISEDIFAPGNNSKTFNNVSFVDVANKDFHLAGNDNIAIGSGVSLSSDSDLSFSNDVDNQTRSGSWDIGADQYVKTDSAAPVISSFSISKGSTSKTVAVNLDVSDTGGSGIWQYLISENSDKNGGSWTTTKPISFTFSSSGSKTAYVWVKDIAGNISDASSDTTTISLDTTPPTISKFILPASSSSNTVSVSNFQASDNIGIAGYLVTQTSSVPSKDDSGWVSNPPSSYKFTAVGSQTAYAWAKDNAGNISSAATAKININLTDNTIPVVSSFTMPSVSNSTAVPIADFQASDNVGIAKYLITESSLTPLSDDPRWSSDIPTSFTFGGSGSRTAYAWVKDTSDNISRSLSAVVSISFLKIGVRSDVHFDIDKYMSRADSAIDAINIFNNNNVDFVMGLGDMYEGFFADLNDYLSNRDNPTDVPNPSGGFYNFQQIWQTSKADVRWTIGNHEISGISVSQYLNGNAFIPGNKNFTYNLGSDWRVIFYCNTDGYLFSATKDTIAWLKNTLHQAVVDNKKVIIAIHNRIDQDYPGNPPVYVQVNDLNSFYSYNASEQRRVLENVLLTDGTKAVKYVFQGHQHINDSSVVNGIKYYEFPSGAVNNKTAAIVKINGDDSLTVNGFGEQKNYVNNTAPVISSFSMPQISNSKTVAIEDFKSDSSNIAGYLISEDNVQPSVDDPKWTSYVPQTFKFSKCGQQTAYFWVKDTTGNISQSKSVTVNIPHLEFTPKDTSVMIEQNIIAPVGDADITSAKKINFTEPTLISFDNGTKITIPSGANFSTSVKSDFTKMTGSVLSEVTGLPSGYNHIGNVSYGLSSEPIATDPDHPATIQIFVGSGHEGEVLSVLRKEGNNTSWNKIDTCVVSDNFCEFTTTSFSEFVAVSQSSSTPATTPNSNSNNSLTTLNLSNCTDQYPSTSPRLFEIRRSKDQAKLFFTSAGSPTSYYFIAYGPKNDPQRYGVTFDKKNYDGILDFTVKKLDKKMDYSFQVRGGNGCMPGNWSNALLTKPNKTTYLKETNKIIKKASSFVGAVKGVFSKSSIVLVPTPVKETKVSDVPEKQNNVQKLDIEKENYFQKVFDFFTNIKNGFLKFKK